VERGLTATSLGLLFKLSKPIFVCRHLGATSDLRRVY
jgi:hypothetical protein